jgi:hypothetical protein
MHSWLEAVGGSRRTGTRATSTSTARWVCLAAALEDAHERRVVHARGLGEHHPFDL